MWIMGGVAAILSLLRDKFRVRQLEQAHKPSLFCYSSSLSITAAEHQQTLQATLSTKASHSVLPPMWPLSFVTTRLWEHSEGEQKGGNSQRLGGLLQSDVSLITTGLLHSGACSCCVCLYKSRNCAMEEGGPHRPYSGLRDSGSWWLLGEGELIFFGVVASLVFSIPQRMSPTPMSIQEAVIWLSRCFVLLWRECEVGRGL